MTGVLIVLIVLLFVIWCFMPLQTNLPDTYAIFKEKYPNKWKQLLVIFFNGPIVIIVFGLPWLHYCITNSVSKKNIISLNEWLEKE